MNKRKKKKLMRQFLTKPFISFSVTPIYQKSKSDWIEFAIKMGEKSRAKKHKNLSDKQ
jgi:hypothetical protein